MSGTSVALSIGANHEPAPPSPNHPDTASRATEIRFEHVSKRFDGADSAVPAVHDVNFTIEPGEFTVLIGPSGCGKTTLLKLINRHYDPTEGTIYVDGTPSQQLPGPDLRRHMGY